MGTGRLDFFHRIAEPESARVRRFITDNDLVGRARFLNVDANAEAQQLLSARGGGKTPALWDGERLYEGVEQVVGRLELELR